MRRKGEEDLEEPQAGEEDGESKENEDKVEQEEGFDGMALVEEEAEEKTEQNFSKKHLC